MASKSGAETRAAFAARSLSYVAQIGFHFALNPRRNIHNALARRTGSGHFIVRGADQITRVSFADELRDRATRENRNIIGMRLERGEYFAGMRFAGSGALHKNAFCEGRGYALWRRPGPLRNVEAARFQQRTADQKFTDEISTFHQALQGKPQSVSPALNFRVRLRTNSWHPRHSQ